MLHTRFLALDEAFRIRTLRERAILGCGIVAMVFLSIDSSLIQPIAAELDRAELATLRVEEEIDQLTKQTQGLSRVELTDEELRVLQQKKLLQTQLSEINAQIAAQVSELVPPEAVVSLLEDMLSPNRALRLVSLQSQSPHRMGSTQSDSKILDSTAGLYRHGVRIEIEGDYSSTVDYLKRVENSPWHLLWDRLEYRVKQYPTATITIDIHTISENEEWIGV